MAQHFEFIDFSKNDKATRRRARSHAMRGKNAGKKLYRRSRLNTDRHFHGAQTALIKQVEREPQNDNTNDILLTSRDCVGNELLSLPYSVEHTPRNKQIISNFFTGIVDTLCFPQLCHSINESKSWWLQQLCEDKTLYHCSIATMATINAFFSDREVLHAEAIYHLNQAIRLVNRKLHRPEGLSDSNLSVVNALIVQGLFHDIGTGVEIHTKGLKMMVELRGGLSQLATNRQLLLKICKTDIDCALHYGTQTCFYRDCMSNVKAQLEMDGLWYKPTQLDIKPRFSKMDPLLTGVLEDVTKITSLFNSNGSKFRMDPNVLLEVTLSAGYRLVQFHQLCKPPLENRIEAAYHIGLTTFITTQFFQIGHRWLLKYKLVGICLKNVIDRGLREEDSDIMLWLLLLGSISVLENIDQNWLVPKLQRVSRNLALNNWNDAHRHLLRLPWIDSLHSEPAEQLWNSLKDA